MVTVFCERLNWRSLALLAAHYSERMKGGVRSELVPLVELTEIEPADARLLYEAGLTTVQKVWQKCCVLWKVWQIRGSFSFVGSASKSKKQKQISFCFCKV